MDKKITFFLNEILGQAYTLHDELGEFYPFGLLLTKEEKPKNFNVFEEKMSTTEMYKKTKELLQEKVLEEDKFLMAGVCCDAKINGKDSLVVELIGRKTKGWIGVSLAYQKQSGKFIYDDSLKDL